MSLQIYYLFCFSYAEPSGNITVYVENQTSTTRNVLKEWRRLCNYGGILNCPAILDGNNDAIQMAKQYSHSNPRHPIQDREFTEVTKNCSGFKTETGYTDNRVSKEELDFPLAFSILFHKDLEQVENLLRTIYRPHNWYCLHLDADASEVFLVFNGSVVMQKSWGVVKEQQLRDNVYRLLWL